MFLGEAKYGTKVGMASSTETNLCAIKIMHKMPSRLHILFKLLKSPIKIQKVLFWNQK